MSEPSNVPLGTENWMSVTGVPDESVVADELDESLAVVLVSSALAEDVPSEDRLCMGALLAEALELVPCPGPVSVGLVTEEDAVGDSVSVEVPTLGADELPLEGSLDTTSSFGV